MKGLWNTHLADLQMPLNSQILQVAWEEPIKKTPTTVNWSSAQLVKDRQDIFNFAWWPES